MTKISLNGKWQLRWSNGARGGSVERLLIDDPELQRALPAQVPGSVHLDLMQAGLLDEPVVGLNSLKARWVEENYWFYRKSFMAPSVESGDQVFLHLECLDLIAVIYLNGQKIGQHANAFYPYQVNVTNFLRPGENTIVVSLESGLFTTAEKPINGYGLAYDGSLHKRHWLRQTQSSFEWDWSPRLLNVGIRGDAWLEVCKNVRLESFVTLSELDRTLQTGKVTGRMFIELFNDQPLNGKYTLDIGDIHNSTNLNLVPGMNQVELEITVPDPELWWPVGHGNQPLYLVKAELSVEGAEGYFREEIHAERKVGFRFVEIDQSPHPVSGHYFIIKVNHKSIFCKGGNLVPADPILSRLDRERYETLVSRALEANFNLLRVWGGGLYESNDFYELCDEKGILVWQEFIFACAKFPLHDENFLANVEQEAIFQVRRLANHPSLVVWCGNNEMEWGAWSWGYEKGVAHPDYALFHLILPRVLKNEDGTRYYQPSSPYSPDLLPPNQDDAGDQHPWSVGFGNTDFRDYRQMICRFPNEGGFLGPTALPTLRACLELTPEKPHLDHKATQVQPSGSTRSTLQNLPMSPFNTHNGCVQSFSFEIHDNQIAYWGNRTQIDLAIDQWLGLNVQQMSLEDYAYYGGLLQGEALQEYIRNFRRRMFDSSSAIFWMYNDCWPATRSWTIVDYYGRRTPSFHPVRRAFLPTAVFIAVDDYQVEIYCVNEGDQQNVKLEFGLCSLTGDFPVRIKKTSKVPSNASILLATISMKEWELAGITTHCAFAILRTETNDEISRDVFFLPYFKEMTWPKADVKIKLVDGKAIIKSNVFAWRVCLDLDGRALPDNFFDVLPGIPTVLDWSEELGKPKILRTGNLISPW